jgi:hypothetical protein
MFFDDEEGYDEMLEMIALVEGTRYMEPKFMNLKKHLRLNRNLEEMLACYTENSFRQTARMNKTSFLKMVDLISEDKVFKSADSYGHHKQAPVWLQVMIVLQRLGCDGNGVSVGRLATQGGFGVGTVCKFTERVYGAIRKLRRQVIAWPDAEERKAISARMDMLYGILGCWDC